MNEILTDEALTDLTGAIYPSVQAAVLDAHGIFYIRRRDGKIKVTWFSVNHPKAGERPNEVPDFSGFGDGKKTHAS